MAKYAPPRGAQPSAPGRGGAAWQTRAVDLWIVQARRVLEGRAFVRRERRGESTLDSLVRGDARAQGGDEGVGASIALCLQLARALLSWGMPAHRVEQSLERLASALDLDVEAFSTPTAILATLGDGEQLVTRVVRVEPGGTDLERLAALHELVSRVERHELTPGDAKRRLDAILARTPRYGAAASVAAYGLVSTSAAALLGGGLVDLPVAAALGLLVGAGEALATRFGSLGRLLPALGAALASFLGTAIAAAGLPVQPSVLLVAAVIVLLPGFTLTTAMMELASAHLVSGTARLAAAAITFLQLGFGVALGRALAQVIPEVSHTSALSPLPEWALLVAPFVSALGFGVLLRARPSHALPVLASVFLALLGSRLGGRVLGPELGAFVGAFVVAGAAHLYARRTDQPTTLMLVPGILFMVPGSIGFLSVSSILAQDVENAVITAFRMFLVAMALAAGLLAASAAIPPRQPL